MIRDDINTYQIHNNAWYAYLVIQSRRAQVISHFFCSEMVKLARACDGGGVYIYVCVLKKGKFFQRKTRGKMQERIFVICEM